MMQEDAQLAIIRVALVAKGVLHFGLVACGGAGEIVGAHCDGCVAAELDLVIVEDNVRPALTTVDGEATVLFVAILDILFTNKVGHGLFSSWAEWILGSLCWLKEYIRLAIAIELACSSRSNINKVCLVEVRFADGFDCR